MNLDKINSLLLDENGLLLPIIKELVEESTYQAKGGEFIAYLIDNSEKYDDLKTILTLSVEQSGLILPNRAFNPLLYEQMK